ncbi:ATP-dependent zinc metalloprotease FtsH [Vibrio natriegens]|uniref:ATP-dependent zinc metalloprotease FtsH n=1 Tax=Vibrio natriegens NBRC 15636 = ATCC 14048 = DSM 759 TaxID=1219067 RepID=A0AAN1CW84_VIBNA|nr:ATP-dependent zinc metalloprotease FtsH [Vibrio natriegens]ALR14733.1 ATP-dependent metalloprotease [Vibrio natriegens NBRC 15636 = ATCC 14048 = DSM 759]ANQ13402.1 ATP-dependent metalloprotease [Vibrio natriegens NBRC 15636 = ATCC 14048 = DSM 759]EPM41289.1 ATP-dependent metalloprotease [Vibrio natriegens NBRC 15636 = ATCC 14048 = DSM 759]MDX6027840.1 ATP-dependent zinc metalloprotease FtsH [Vibrio natriegens NBRC 15636 = ATCC 14048 = DSM 759]UUI11144.1 ATP-dependent zinc metalloprotease Ft
MAKNLILWLVIAVVLMSVFQSFGPGESNGRTVDYTTFVQEVGQGQIQEATFKDGEISFVRRGGGAKMVTYMPVYDQKLLDDLINQNVKVQGTPPEEQSLLGTIFISWFPMILLIGVWIFFMRQMQGGGGKGAMSFGKSKARMMSEEQIKTTFADVAGCDEAKEDVKELVDYLRDPSRFQKLGGKIPTGVLMVGPPGTGKTLLAKAIAGEAKVPFFTISGSDFVEMFVGVGASRVRDMFEQAKKASPCIIFIDEIDAVGRQRGAGVGGGHDEREQTLNQMLVEMDGFEGNEGIIVIAATNRPDVLDPALLRPGRFDRQVVVGLPDVRGREQILKVHMRKVPLAGDVEPSLIARGTPGFSGADLANLVNEAALFAARGNKRNVSMVEFELAKDKIMMGAERRSMVMSEETKASTAYHEAGHAIVGRLVPEHDPVYKVSIIPRGRALGVTMYLPEQDRVSMSRQHLESMISSLYGGRLAEELIYGAEKVSTGASNDIERATDIARKMVTQWGFSEKLGPLLYAEDEGEVFLGRSVTQTKHMSDDTAKLIDDEVRQIIDRNYDRAKKILQDNMDIMHAMKDALMKYETIDAHQIDDLMERKAEIREPAGWGDNPSNKPQVDDKPQAAPAAKEEEKKADADNDAEQSTSQEAASADAPEKKDSE